MAALVASPNCSIKCTFLGYPRFLSGLDRRFNTGEHIAKIIHLTFTKLLKQPAINNFFFLMLSCLQQHAIHFDSREVIKQVLTRVLMLKLNQAQLNYLPPVFSHECFFCPRIFFSITELYELGESVGQGVDLYYPDKTSDDKSEVIHHLASNCFESISQSCNCRKVLNMQDLKSHFCNLAGGVQQVQEHNYRKYSSSSSGVPFECQTCITFRKNNSKNCLWIQAGKFSSSCCCSLLGSRFN